VTGSTTPSCPSCQGTQLRVIGKLPDVTQFAGRTMAQALPASQLFCCRACGLRFRHPVLDRSAYDALYGAGDPDCWPDEGERRDWALISDFISREATAGASVLDFGCHTGGLLARLGQPHSRMGVEVNRNAAAVAEARAGVAIFPSLDALPHDRRFDFVTAVDVVEHFSNPGDLIASLLAKVKPGGCLIITSGDAETPLWRLAGARWWYCYYPEHLAFISEGWMRNWLRTSGQPASIAALRRFRHVKLPLARFARQALQAAIYYLAPRAYLWSIGRLKRAPSRENDGELLGAGLSKDHLMLVLRKHA
jgi:SAM-dependent methyltransferase